MLFFIFKIGSFLSNSVHAVYVMYICFQKWYVTFTYRTSEAKLILMHLFVVPYIQEGYKFS